MTVLYDKTFNLLRNNAKILDTLWLLVDNKKMTNHFKALSLIPHRRLLFISLLGFFSGLPLALSGSTLQAWLTEAHVNLMMIGFLSLISFPYNFKFLWAPLLDRFVFPGLGRRRGWILLTQLGLALCLFALAVLHPESQLQNIGWLVLLLCFIAATQDVAIDAYRADTLLPEERGLGSALFIFAYRMALFVSGGLALVVANYWGWERAFQFLGSLMLLGMIATYFAPEAQFAQETASKKSLFFIEPFLDLWRRDRIILILAFVVLYKAGAALAVALWTNFLLHGLGFSLVEIGVASKAAIITGTILGAMVGGALMVRISLFSALFWFGLAQAVSILLFLILSLAGKVFFLMVLCSFLENFCSGMSTAAFLAFLMSLCRAQYSATQFAFLSAIDSLARMMSGPFAAWLVGHYGWITLYSTSFMMSLPAIALLLIMNKRLRFNVPLVSLS